MPAEKTMSDPAITENSEITLHFALKLDSGEIVDSNFDAEPAHCRFGDGSLLPGFEQHLLGLRAGDRREFVIGVAAGFGEVNSDNVQTFSRSRFTGLTLEPGLVVSFADAANNELPGVVCSVDGDSVTVDFNHPLAGRSILFQVHILDVRSR
jgi:FKBP-type peptidyl-prolyl cis-trans isomerase SlpA